jgi:hypothetical protein
MVPPPPPPVRPLNTASPAPLLVVVVENRVLSLTGPRVTESPCAGDETPRPASAQMPQMTVVFILPSFTTEDYRNPPDPTRGSLGAVE